MTVTPLFKVSRVKCDPQTERDLCHARAGHICQRCTIRRSTLAHHILLRKHGGPDCADNLLAVCETCHLKIHAVPVDAYREGWMRRLHPKPGDHFYEGINE